MNSISTILRFSVFTSTYNRASFLTKVYESLLRQTYQNFEWVIIDDGSTDNTDSLIQNFIDKGKLKIRYIKKENGGKHTAWRIATEMFRGKYVLSIDSDDSLTPQALEIFNKHWNELENSNVYDEFWEVKARNMYENGRIVGNALPKDIFDTYAHILTYKFKVTGDLHGCRKTSVLRNEAKVPDNFMFEDKCSNFQESIRWFRAGKKYKTRYVEEVTSIVSLAAEDRLSSSDNKKIKKNFYNSLVNVIYKLHESREDILRWDKRTYFELIAKTLYVSFRLRKNPFKLPFEKFYILDHFFLILGFFPIYILYKIRG
ncbi:glycosyltransferase family 2 protein [Litoribacter ruber]|uniref:glycosyltransferase family 2 protein n=1 Tax=Litoribacter ruber TaxID=702568 RepID=UPI001BDABF5B|nr:glycosyltransferase family 2 protein [Litoribacter ruber]MBT0812923.1 glycosyltransferase family 2 protein [Litoribacter ruber]